MPRSRESGDASDGSIAPVARREFVFGALLILGGSASAFGQPAFRGLGVPGAYPFAISADRSTVVGVERMFASSEAFRWRRSGTMVTYERLGLAPHPCDKTPESPDCSGTPMSRAYAVSADGEVVAGGSGHYDVNYPWVYPFRWTENLGLVSLPVSPFDSTEALVMSPDGRTLYGRGQYSQLSAWTQETGWSVVDPRVRLNGYLGPNTFVPLFDVSSEGGKLTMTGLGTIAGHTSAFVLTIPEGGLLLLGDLLGGKGYTAPVAVSADGNWVVGFTASEEGLQAFRARTVDGVMAGLGDLPTGEFQSVSMAVSRDGARVVGFSSVLADGNPRTARAFIWEHATGMSDLAAVMVTDYGLDLSGWRLFWATDMTPDGRTIIGWGRNPAGESEGWIADLGDPPTPCPADWNSDGSLTSADFFAFITDFLCQGQGCRTADFNADGRENSQDFFDFVVAFFEGCG